MSHRSFLTLILFCLACLIAFSHALNNGFSVELIHRDSFKSPLYHPTETKFQRIFNTVRRSINRDIHFNKKNSSFGSTLTFDNDGVYLMSYSIGTPPFKVNGLIDTATDMVWVQCKPCNICYNQTSPIFNPSKSSSYQKIPCSSRTCKSLENIPCSHDDDTCQYESRYGGGTASHGDLSMETLTMNFTSDSSESFPNFLIGCGHTNNMAYNKNGHISGIIGFGPGPMSLINQLGSSIGWKFSYCLNGVRSNLSSKLNFGDAAIVSIVRPASGNLSYYLNLKAFSVGNKRLKFKGFKREGLNISTQTIIIDSGTTVTIVPHRFYTKLESAVAKAVKLERVQDHTGSFNLCYNTTSKHSNFPVIIAHFSGADVKLDSKGTFVAIEEGVECLTFRPSPRGGALFGNLAQQNFLVGYDLKNNIVSFKPTDCSTY
ncbi:hypothetical protein TSUD_113940 [Trifolium subterraneum]|uniref:Peptidase A1 domain-containing protein n=1 Tax=Trifolium subterraneum TaxID=3900 RepID=A0A2Z6M5Z9_TRISU|nr:hypothetical protein TSUD_113940 [Trifolium subterraneum]